MFFQILQRFLLLINTLEVSNLDFPNVPVQLSAYSTALLYNLLYCRYEPYSILFILIKYNNCSILKLSYLKCKNRRFILCAVNSFTFLSLIIIIINSIIFPIYYLFYWIIGKFKFLMSAIGNYDKI